MKKYKNLGGGDPFYRSRAWKRARREALELTQGFCHQCKGRGKLTRAQVVHHINPRLEFPKLALSLYDETGALNLEPLCHECHEAIERARGNRANKRTRELAEHLQEWW